MELHPKRQPGRADRKAASYAPEIKRLRVAGYTYEAIREALAAVGVQLSTSALRREMRRIDLHKSSASGQQSQTRPPRIGPAKLDRPSPPTQASSVPSSNSRELAEAFFSAHPSNPLIRTKDSE